jgi:hypothetical protein
VSVTGSGGMRPIYVDYVPRWVPIVSGLLIVVGAWFGGNLAHFDLQTTTSFAIFLLGALVVAVFFQGRYYWRGQIKSLSADGMRYEALTSVWIGMGRRFAFAPTEARGWASKAGPPSADGSKPLPAAIGFTVRGEKLSISLINPKLLDLDALGAINPAWFHKLRADFPGLKSVKDNSSKP